MRSGWKMSSTDRNIVAGNALRLPLTLQNAQEIPGSKQTCTQGSDGMAGLLILIPAALLLGGLGLVAFLRSFRSGQFDDLTDRPCAYWLKMSL